MSPDFIIPGVYLAATIGLGGWVIWLATRPKKVPERSGWDQRVDWKSFSFTVAAMLPGDHGWISDSHIHCCGEDASVYIDPGAPVFHNIVEGDGGWVHKEQDGYHIQLLASSYPLRPKCDVRSNYIKTIEEPSE